MKQTHSNFFHAHYGKESRDDKLQGVREIIHLNNTGGRFT